MSTVDEQLPPPPQPPQPHRISTSCDRHPDEHFTGFCPSCLFERLTVLDQSSASNPNTTAARKSTSSALKSVFRASAVGERTSFRTRPGSFFPELRRTKSFTSRKDNAGSGVASIFEPQRKSCDVRARSSLFIQEDGKRATELQETAANSANEAAREEELEGKFGSSTDIVVDLKEERVSDLEEHRDRANGGEIQEIEEPIALNNSISDPKLSSEERMEMPEKVNLKSTKKGNIDLDSRTKKASGMDSKERSGSFWSAASLFSKKLKAWTTKSNKLKKHSGGRTVQVSKKSNAGRSYKETQSEVADYGYGRRSCDIDPRFCMDAGRMSLDYGRMSLDAGRMSFDDPRYSFDEPRASWDGHLIGGGRLTNMQKMMPPMVSLREDPAPHHQPSMMVVRKDNLIPLEEPRKSIHEEEGVPGGADETKDYYLDSSSSRRRKSLDRSSSIRRTAASVVAEVDDTKPAPFNGKATPASMDYLHGGSVKGMMGLAGDRGVLRDSNPNPLRDDCSEIFDMGFRESASVIGNTSERKIVKKSRSWKSWNIWGLIARRASNKDEDDDDRFRDNGADRSYSESWQELGRDGYGVNPRGSFSRNGFRCNSSVSWRNSNSYCTSGPVGGILRKSNAEKNGASNEFVLERKRSARYSPNHIESAQLRFHMTAVGSSRGATMEAKAAAYSRTMSGNVLQTS